MTTNETTLHVHKRTITVTRIFDASIDLMWRAWTEPDLIKHWWGSGGFTYNAIPTPTINPILCRHLLKGTSSPVIENTFVEYVGPKSNVFFSSN